MRSSRSVWMRRAEAAAVLAVVAFVLVVVITRSTPPKRNSGSAPSPAGSAAGPGPVPGTGAGSASTGDYLPQLQHEASSATQGTFKATYQAKGSTVTITYAQIGARTSFVTGATAYYADGTSNTVCDSSSGTPTCTTGAKPLTGLLSLVSPTAVASALRAAATAGAAVGHSTERHNGQPSSCLRYVTAGQHVKFCINDLGIVNYIKIPAGVFELTAYTTVVSAADVSVPPGATLRPASSTQ